MNLKEYGNKLLDKLHNYSEWILFVPNMNTNKLIIQ